MSLIWIIYIGYFQPYKQLVDNKLEIFNEICLLCSTYPLFAFTDYILDVDIKYNTGWILITATSINILVNLVILVKRTVYRLGEILNKKCEKK